MNKEREQLVQQLYELQKEVVSTQNNLRNYEAASISATRKSEMTKITLRELDTIEATAKVYKPIGRVFVNKPKEDLVADLTKLVEEKEGEKIEYKVTLENSFRKARNIMGRNFRIWRIN